MKRASHGSKPGRTNPRVSSGRRWLFRGMAVGLPLLMLLGAELGLRWIGYGYSTDYFLSAQVQGRPVWIENAAFTRRYFPPGLLRTPQPLVLDAAKGTQTTRLFVFGESAAMGDPEPAYGFSRMLEVMLRDRYSNRKFEVVNVATTAINSHVIRDIARACVPRSGDLWIVYMGNNEVVGPFGAGTVFSSGTPSLGLIRAGLAFKATRLGQAFDALRHRVSGGSGAPREWGGMEMFLDKTVAASDPAMARVYAHFQRNLEDIVAYAMHSGARVLLATVPSNLRDCAPFASVHGQSLTSEQQAAWDAAFRAGIERQQAGDPAQALDAFRKAAALDDGWAELAFRTGQCLEALGQGREARGQFERARDLDALRFRADTTINAMIREAAARREKHGEGIRLLDAEALMADASPEGLTGREYFHEHVHLNFDGNYVLAREMAGALAVWCPELLGQPRAADWMTRDQCAGALAWTDWNWLRVAEEMVSRLSLAPFTDQANHSERMNLLVGEVERLQLVVAGAGRGEALAGYEKAVGGRPEDWVLRDHQALLLQDTGDYRAATEVWREVLARIPHYAPAYYHLANGLDKLGRSEEAERNYREALKRSPEMHEARNGLALALASQGRDEEARHCLETLIAIKPDFVEARVNLGRMLYAQGLAELAKAQYETALTHNSNSVAAHLNLGRLLTDAKAWESAEAHYRAAVRSAPDNSLARFNLANLLAGQKRPESMEHYESAIVLDPNFAEARFNYGLELAAQGRDEEALEQFRRVTEAQPGFAEAHLNLGVACAKRGRFAEAIAAFEEALRLNPAHETAKKFLEQARSRLPR